MSDRPANARPPGSPYRGLIPYSEDDAAIFFGRDRERQLIVANLLAYRLTVLYGESGVGKTSVLRAGALHQLRRQSRETLEELGTPEHIVVEFAAWPGDPVAAFNEAVDRSVRLVLGDRAPSAAGLPDRPAERLAAWSERLDTSFLVVLDQFEEYFVYHGHEDGEGTFAAEFPRALNRHDVQANFLISIREDTLARLDRFKGPVPDLFGNLLRVRHLDREAAREAILGPVEHFNRAEGDGSEGVVVEPALVEAVLDQVTTGRVRVGDAGHGVITQDEAVQERIETPYLQLVMSRLWNEERAAGSSTLRLSTLDRLGGAERIISSHLDETMRSLSAEERDVAARVFRFLVTPSGTKIAHTARDLAAYADLPEERLERMLENLAGGSVRILRATSPPPGESMPRYEIFHDVLAPAILDWRSRHDEKRRRAEALEEQRVEADARLRATRRKATWAIAAIGLLVVGWVAYSAMQQRNLARSQALAAQAMSEAALDSQRSLRLALAALDAHPSDQAEDALRLALSQARLRSVIADHRDVVWTVAWSPEGARLVTASSDRTARITHAASGTTIAELRGHADVVTGAAFIPDGTRVITTSWDGTARLWDATTGEELVVMRHDDRVFLAATDGVDLAGGYLATGPLTGDGRLLVTSAGLSAWIWDLATGSLVLRLEHPTAARLVSHSAFSPDGATVVTSAFDGLVRIWDVADGEMRGEPMDNQTEWVTMATFSPDGQLLAAANSDGSVGLMDLETGEQSWYQGHTHEILAVAFSPNGRRLVSAGDTTVRVWDVQDDPVSISVSAVIRSNASWVVGTRFSPDGHHVVTANQDGTARIADAFTGEELIALRGHENIVWTATYSHDGLRLATASEDGTARVWDVSTGLELRGHTLAANSAAFSPDGSMIVTTGVDQSASIWDSRTGEEVHILFGDVADFGWSPMHHATFSPAGDLVVTAQDSGTVALWDVASGEQVGVCCSNQGWNAHRAYFLHGQADRLVVLYLDQTARVWDVADGDDDGVLLHTLEGVLNVAVSPDGRWILTTGRWDKIARVSDAATFEQVSQWDAGLVTGIAVSPDGQRVAMAGLDRIIRVYDTATGDPVAEMVGSTSAVGAVAFSPDGTWLVSGGADGTTRVWNAASGRPLAVLRMHADSVNGLDVAGDGRIVSASTDHTAKVYECLTCGSIAEVIEQARDQVALTRDTR